MIPHEKILPSIMIALQFGSAIPYIIQGNLSMSVYWIAASVLTIAVTWL